MRITGIDVQIKESFPLDSFECTVKTQSVKSLELDPSLDAKIHYKEVGNFEKLKRALKYGKDLIDGPVHKQVKESDKFRESLRDKDGNKKGFLQNRLHVVLESHNTITGEANMFLKSKLFISS